MRQLIFVLVLMMGAGAFAADPPASGSGNQNCNYLQNSTAGFSQACINQQSQCSKVDNDETKIKGLSFADAIKKAIQCAGGSVGTGTSSASTSGTHQNSAQRKAVAACNKKYKSTPDNCIPYAPQDEADAKKEVDALNDKLSEAMKTQADSDHDFNTSMQEQEKQQSQAMQAITNKIPAQVHIDQNAAIIAARQAQTKLNTDVLGYQTAYNSATLTYKKARTAIVTNCYNIAVAAYTAQKQAIDKMKAEQGGGANISSSLLSTYEGKLQGFQAKKMQDCLSNSASVSAAQDAESEYQTAAANLTSEMLVIGKERVEVQEEMKTALNTIQTKAQSDATSAVQQAQDSNKAMIQSTADHANQKNVAQQRIDQLTKERDDAQADETCLEKLVGPVSKSRDSSSNDDKNTAIEAAKDVLADCDAPAVQAACTAQCGSVIPYLKNLSSENRTALDLGPAPAADSPGNTQQQKDAAAAALANSQNGKPAAAQAPPSSNGSNGTVDTTHGP